MFTKFEKEYHETGTLYEFKHSRMKVFVDVDMEL